MLNKAQMNNYLEGENITMGNDMQNIGHVNKSDFNRDKNSTSAQA